MRTCRLAVRHIVIVAAIIFAVLLLRNLMTQLLCLSLQVNTFNFQNHLLYFLVVLSAVFLSDNQVRNFEKREFGTIHNAFRFD
jgi:hypothetical protein